MIHSHENVATHNSMYAGKSVAMHCNMAIRLALPCNTVLQSVLQATLVWDN